MKVPMYFNGKFGGVLNLEIPPKPDDDKHYVLISEDGELKWVETVECE